MDDPKRDKSKSPPDPLDDDAELELEPPDETVTEHQKKMVLEGSRTSIDIDEIFRDADRDYGGEIVDKWVKNFRFRFQVKHMLLATAVLAIVLTLAKLGLLWTSLIVGAMLTVAGVYLYIQREEQRLRGIADRKREAIYARRRAELQARMTGQPLPEITPEPVEPLPELPNAVDELWLESLKREALQFQFSVRQLLIFMTAAAMALGMLRFMGGSSVMTSVLGLIALGGLVVYAAGYEPPKSMVMGWWVTLVLYVVVSILTALMSVFA